MIEIYENLQIWYEKQKLWTLYRSDAGFEILVFSLLLYEFFPLD